MPESKLLILGMGLQGKGALQDAIRSGFFQQITVADYGDIFEKERASYEAQGVQTVSVNADDTEAVRALIKKVTIVIELLPVCFSIKIGRIAAECGVHLVSSMYYIGQSMTDPVIFRKCKAEIDDISRIAKGNGSTLLIAFGMDPGLDLMLGGAALSELDEIDVFNSYGAGFPEDKAANNVLGYKFSWSPHSTLVSYNRSIKKIVDGVVVDVPASKLFAPENTHIFHEETLGYDLECFSTGNCQNFAAMFGIQGKVRQMDRYSCRRVGHCAFWDKVVNCGFLNDVPVLVNGIPVSPIDFTTALLQSQNQFWFEKDERDIGYIRVEVMGKKNNVPKHITYTIIDYKDIKTGLTSMQRLVGYTVSIAAELIVQDKINARGIVLPMQIGLELMQGELEKRNIHITKIEK